MKTAWSIGFVQQLGSLQRGKKKIPLALHFALTALSSSCKVHPFLECAPALSCLSYFALKQTVIKRKKKHHLLQGVAIKKSKEEIYVFFEFWGFCCFVGCHDLTNINSIIRGTKGRKVSVSLLTRLPFSFFFIFFFMWPNIRSPSPISSSAPICYPCCSHTPLFWYTN